MNTSFIERLNLTIRQSSAYLSRRTLSHARSTERLDEHLELLRCYYNFFRPHGALKFGREIRTPAMQAGLTIRRLTFRDIFLATTIPLWARIEVFLLTGACNPVSSAPVPLARSRVATLDGGSTGHDGHATIKTWTKPLQLRRRLPSPGLSSSPGGSSSPRRWLR